MSLKEYFKKYEDELSELSKERLKTNPLRILDDKLDGKKQFVKNSPKIIDFLSKKELEDFEHFKMILNNAGINFIVDDTLVRGLDYYTNLVFEITSTDERLASQPTIIGGGRYAKLVNELGGEECSCLGFALGVERLLLVCEYENTFLPKKQSIDVVIACLVNDAIDIVFNLLKILRNQNIASICKFETNKLTKILSYANHINSNFVIIVGTKEMKANTFIVKNLKTNQQKELSQNEIINFIKGK
jgi:histidyl-tRNA synthetase